MTGFAKIYVVYMHASKFLTLVTHKINYDCHTEMKCTWIVELQFLYHF